MINSLKEYKNRLFKKPIAFIVFKTLVFLILLFPSALACIISFSLGVHFHDMYVSKYVVVFVVSFIICLTTGCLGSIIWYQVNIENIRIVMASKVSDSFAFEKMHISENNETIKNGDD